MNKVKYFEDNVIEFQKLCGIKDEILVQKDNRLKKSFASVNTWIWVDTMKPFFLIKYNEKLMPKANKRQIIQTIFHELGHIKHDHFCSCLSLFEKEYQAEKFALINIQKHRPEYYKSYIKGLKNTVKSYNVASKRVYIRAFARILKEENIKLS